MATFLIACKEEQEAFTTSASTNAPKSADQVAQTPAAAEPAEPAVQKTSPSKPAPSLAPPKDRPRFAEGETIEMKNFGFPGIRMDIPVEWEQQPGAGMRLTQFVSATDPNGKKADFVVFYFGPEQGGTAASNLARWALQVKAENDPLIYQYEQDGLLISEILTKGTLMPSTMGAGPTEPQENAFLYGIIVVGGVQGSVFFKATGPQTLLTKLAPQYTAMVESIKQDAKAKPPMNVIPQPDEDEVPAPEPSAESAP